ncbi:DUF2806 domain-containing protein [Citrobacter farmeri]|nr:DUF2806 domain-containing protein [Citrobacter farmeri]
MSEEDKSGLDAFTETITGVPQPIQKSIFKAIGSLLEGLIELPIAKLNQLTQAINDKTEANKITASALAKAAADNMVNDQELVAIAAEAYLPTAVRKIRNRFNVAQCAVAHLKDKVHEVDSDKIKAPDENWMNNFMRYAEDASSEELQDRMGRLLAGEVLHPGAYSLTTLRTLNELDSNLASDFLEAWSKSVGESVDYCAEWKRGSGYNRWQRLIEAGLMSSSTSARFIPEITDNSIGVWAPMQTNDVWINISFRKESTVHWTHIPFTRTGREIATLLPNPDYENNIRQAALRLQKQGLVDITLRKAAGDTELLWTAKV